MNNRMKSKVDSLELKFSQKSSIGLIHVINEDFGNYCEDISKTKITDENGIAYTEKQYYEKYPEKKGYPEYYTYQEKTFLTVKDIKKQYPEFDRDKITTIELRFVS